MTLEKKAFGLSKARARMISMWSGKWLGDATRVTGDQFRDSKWGVRGLAFSAGNWANWANCTEYTLVSSYFVP